MKFQNYLKRVEKSQEFKEFKNKNPKAYLCAGFFVLDFDTGQNLYQIDYFLPNKKIATFNVGKKIEMKISDQTIKKKLPEISSKAKTDIDALKDIVEDEMKNQMVTEEIRKIIAVLHIFEGKLIWNLQCFLSGLEILNVHIDDSDQTILKFEKYSLMDIIRKMPMPMPEQEPKENREEINPEQLKELEEKLKKVLKKDKEKKK